ncbi:MAG: PspC domain-containing protein [Saprospiraceae bacterium]|nr:PspC domain-containing protein [Saprospiraceae bacterium]
MNKTFNINLGGYPFAIDEDAYEYIQNYLNTIRRHFSASDGCDEIIYDIEVRMAELFQEHLNGRSIISMKEIDEVIMIMGKPEDFGADPIDEPYQFNSKNKKSTNGIGTGKRLFRDPDDKTIAGVCSGIAAYFGIEDPLWVRLIFAILLFTGAGVITYFVLWALVPVASSSSDKLAMRGEPATIENIAKLVEEELTELGDKINEWSKDIGGKKKSESLKNGFEAKSFIASGVNMFGSVISGLVLGLSKILKPLVIFAAIVILSILGVTWAASFIGLSMASPIMFAMGPSSSFLSVLGIGSIYFTIGLPILGLMLYIARLAFRYKVHRHVKTGFWTVWFLSLFVSSFAAMSTIKEYSSHYETKNLMDYDITSPEIKIKMPEENMDHSFGISIGDFITEKDNQWAFRDVNFSIEKSKDNKVHIEKIISAKGQSSQLAQKNALLASNDISVNGNEIQISKYLTFPKSEKYRNQQIDYVIYIPEGKSVSFDENSKERLRSSSVLSWDQIYDSAADLPWTMAANGLQSNAWNDKHHFVKNIADENFSKIIIEDGFEISITKADQSSVSIEGNKEIIERLDTKNLTGTLHIGSNGNDDLSGIKINIKTPVLEMIHFDGIKSAKIDGFDQDNLKVISLGEYDGAGETDIEFMGNIKNLDISLEGEQTFKLTGSGNNLDIHCENDARLVADKFLVKNAVWNGNSEFGSSLHVTDKFSTSDPEVINVKLFGNPQKVKL